MRSAQDPPSEAGRARPDRLAAFATDVLTAVGVPAADAALVAGCLVEAELWGHPSHGLLRLSWYVARIRSGVIDPLAAPRTVVDRGAMRLRQRWRRRATPEREPW